MKLILLDRDGVINHDSANYIRSPEEWHPIPRSLEAIAHLKQAGFTVAVVTNQSGIARDYYTHETLAAIHEKMQTLLTNQFNTCIDAIFYCPHHPNDLCACRKPKAGLLHQAQAHFSCDTLFNVPMVGDSPADIGAAKTAGCTPILVKTGNGKKTIQSCDPTITCYDDLFSAVQALI